MNLKKFQLIKTKKDIKNVNKLMKNPEVVTLLAVTAPWCGHCQSFKPEWKELLSHFNNEQNLILGNVEESNMNELDCIKKKPVHGFPTIRLIQQGGKKQKDYNGKRDCNSLERFIRDAIKSAKGIVESGYNMTRKIGNTLLRGGRRRKVKKTRKRKTKKRRRRRKKRSRKKRSRKSSKIKKFYKMIEGKF
tara:strand:+ start:35 stop:604 length:570 start_codon:yes stop_codon:yes gene_type:complete